MSPTHAPRRWFPSWITGVWLTVVWVLLWGQLSVANVLAGIVVATVITLALPMPRIDVHMRWRLLGTGALLGWFVIDLLRASVEVAALALSPRRVPQGAVIAVPLRSRSDLYLTITAQLTALVPGSVVVESRRLAGVIYVHVLDVATSGGIEAARRQVQRQEERVLRAMASPQELAAAGLEPVRWRRARRAAAVEIPAGRAAAAPGTLAEQPTTGQPAQPTTEVQP